MNLPRSVVRDLNAIGFVLMQDEPPFTFVRVALGSDVYMRLETLAEDRWRVTLSYREPVNWGTTPNPVVPVSLAKLGAESGGDALQLDTAALVRDFPALLERCILPTIDLAPS